MRVCVCVCVCLNVCAAATADARDLQLRLAAKKKEREASEETKRVYRQQLENLKQQKEQLEVILREKVRASPCD